MTQEGMKHNQRATTASLSSMVSTEENQKMGHLTTRAAPSLKTSAILTGRKLVRGSLSVNVS